MSRAITYGCSVETPHEPKALSQKAPWKNAWTAINLKVKTLAVKVLTPHLKPEPANTPQRIHGWPSENLTAILIEYS